MEHIRPISPVAGYVGGKRALSKILVPMIRDIPHDLYSEAFVGMGGVFFRRDQRPKVEVINDLSRDVATFFRVLQRHYQAFLDMLRWQVSSRAEFERLTTVDPQTLTDLERAARFLYLQKLSFGGKVAGRTMGISLHQPAKFDVSRLVPLLEAAHERLGGVYIECLRWQAFLDRWDRPGALHFLDPPYWGTEGYYGKNLFDRSQFTELSDRLRRVEGAFVLTINDCPEIRDLFGWAHMTSAELLYTTGGRPVQARELIISKGVPRAI